MKTINVQSIEELKDQLQSFGVDVLFRGQTRHFVDADGKPNIPTSFARHGCVPPLMQRWAHYAGTSIQALAGPGSPEPSIELEQAVLQHYGWRSFYIDVTKSPNVAAWFASHRFVSKVHLHLCEDCFEDPILLRIEQAVYEASEESTGHIYVISTEHASVAGARFLDLNQEITSDAPLRFHAQAAGLLGPYTYGLLAESVIAHLLVPTELLSSYAREGGIDEASQLFPTRLQDPLLRLLLATPWTHISDDVGRISAFRRSLALPEYDDAFIKHRPPSDAFFTEVWVDENRGNQDSFFAAALFVRMAEDMFYGSPVNLDMRLPRTAELMRKHAKVVLELDGLVRFAEQAQQENYVKGVVLQTYPEGVEVSALVVEHPGQVLSGAGVERGWFYEIHPDGTWARKKDDRECPCNASHRHRQHLLLIHRLEEILGASAPDVRRSLTLDLRD